MSGLQPKYITSIHSIIYEFISIYYIQINERTNEQTKHSTNQKSRANNLTGGQITICSEFNEDTEI